MRREHTLGWEYNRPASPFSNSGPEGVRIARSCNLCRGRKNTVKDCKCQRKAIQSLGLRDNFVKLIAPCGWGKTFYIRYDIVRRAEADPNLKFVIAIPRLAIGRGFCREMMFDMPWGVGKFARLLSRNNLCDDLADERGGVSPSKIARIRRWLRAPATHSLSGRVLLVSHAAMTLAIGSESQLSSVHLYVDEAHHLSQDGCDGDGATRMGRLVKRALDAGCGGLTLTTATYFRGDGRAILTKEHEGRFKTFFVPLDLHMKNNLQRLEKIKFRTIVLQSGEDEWDVVKRLLGRGQRKVIVFLPKRNQAFANGSSHRYARDMARRMSDMGINVECFVGNQSLKKKKLRKFLGVDFTTEEERDAYLRDLGAILTINMFDEGADWPQAELAIDLAPPNAVGRAVQRVGRLLRDEKKACEYVSVYPPLAADGERTREAVSDRQNAALAMMVSMDAQIAGSGMPQHRRRSYLNQILPDIQDQHEFRKLVIELLRSVDTSNETEILHVRKHLTERLITRGATERDAIFAVAELMIGAVRVAAKLGGGISKRLGNAMNVIGSTLNLAELRRLFDIVVADGAGVFSCAVPLTHTELAALRKHVEQLARLYAQLDDSIVESCARDFVKKRGKHPSQQSGCECLPDGWTWRIVANKYRATAYGDMLSFFRDRGISVEKHPFSLAMVERCARAYKVAYGKCPSTQSKSVCLPPGWTWGAINERLRSTPYSGIAGFLLARGVAVDLKPLPLATIERCARTYKAKHGKCPSAISGHECLPQGYTWSLVNDWFRRGRLGNHKSISEFLQVRMVTKKRFSLAMAEQCARAYVKKYGRVPARTSGSKCLPRGWTWIAVICRIRSGRYKNMASFLCAKGVIARMVRFSFTMVERCARAYKAKHGRHPAEKCGGECLPNGWTWRMVGDRLRAATYGSLLGFLRTKSIAAAEREPLSLATAERCARTYRSKYGRCPTTTSGGKCLPNGWTWKKVGRMAARKKYEGLADFLRAKKIAKTAFSLAMAERCARAYKAKHGKCPTEKSGRECLPDGWTWGAVSQRLKSLSKFLHARGIAKARSAFTLAMAKRCARAYKRKHGNRPSQAAGPECLPEGWTWSAVDARLRKTQYRTIAGFLDKKGIG